jgi:hypothetical protein
MLTIMLFTALQHVSIFIHYPQGVSYYVTKVTK